MKKFLILLLIVFLAQPCLAALDPSIDNRKTWKNAYRFTGKPKDLFTDWCEEVEDALDGTSGVNFILYIPTTAPATPEKGQLYFDLAGSNLQYYTTGWNIIANSTSSTLDEAYTAGQGITVDIAAMTIAQGDTAWSTLAISSTAGTTNDYDCVTITTSSAGYTGDSLYINGVTGSTDIRGDSWNMSQAGLLTLTNGEIISNATNDKLLIDTGAEDLVLDFTTGTNTITLTANSSGAVVWDFGEFVTVQGISTLTGSAAGDMTIQHTADTAGEDLIINQAGSGDYSVILNSAGTSAAAIDLTTATGGILLSAKDDIILTCAATTTDDNITIQQTGAFAAGVDILAAGTGTDAILLSASAGGVTLTATGAASGDVVITTVDDFSLVATDDITIDGNSAGSIITIGGNNDGNVINIGVDDSAADAITIGSVKDTIIIDGIAVTLGDTTTTAATIVQSGTGDVTITSTDQIALTVATGATDNIVLTNTASTDVDAISLISTAGGIQHASSDVASTWTHTADGAADDLSFIVAGAFDGSLVLTSSGTEGNAIDINTSAGGIDIDMAGGAAGEDFSIVTATSIDFQPSEAQPGQFKVVAGGTNAGDVIELESTDGRIIIDANGGSNGDIELNSADDIVLTTACKLTITNNTEATTISGALTVSGATTAASFVIVDELVTNAAMTLTAAMSGKIIIIGDLAGNTLIDLPVEADGLNYEFWYTGAATEVQDHTIDTESAGNNFVGGVQWTNSGDDTHTEVYSNGTTHSKLTLVNLQTGSIVKLTCDGSEWYIQGVVYSDTTPAFATQ